MWWLLPGLLVVGLSRGQEPELVPQVGGSGFVTTTSSKIVLGASGDWLATGDQRAVLIYDRKGGRISRRIPAAASVDSIAAHPTAAILAVSDGLSVTSYDVTTGKVVWGDTSAAGCTHLQFSIEGSWLLAVCAINAKGNALTGIPDYVMKKWDGMTGKILPVPPFPGTLRRMCPLAKMPGGLRARESPTRT
jgi:hypothetical protein